MRPLLLESRLHPSIVEFFALIRLHAERPPRRGLLVNIFQSTYHVWTAFGLDGDRPGILGQDIDHGQQIFVALIPSTEFLHVHQIHLPLFVTVKELGGGGRKTRSSGSDGERSSGIWHPCCARVRACQMSSWLRRHSNVLPTLSQVNAQRVLWQKRCDRLLDGVLCNYCVDDKDDAFAAGKGLDWIPDNCSACRPVGRIFEQTVTYREWQAPLMYADDEPHTMWAWNPLSKNSHH